jgi:glycosyltransferase involved in cell wall biosynthesis
MDNPKSLSVCMPVYNERETIEEIVKKVLAVDVPLDIHLVITDDASTDGSDKILEKIAEEYPGKIFIERQPANMGKGAAVNNCLRRADGDVLIIQDADLEYDPNDYGAVLAPILDGEADVVYGSRFTSGRPPTAAKWLYVGNRALTIMFNVVFGTALTDMETCYKAFRREVVSSIEIRSSRFGIEPEITAKIIRAGHSITEVPVSYQARSYEEGKKITAWDGMKAFGAILWYRFFDGPRT